MEAIVYRYVNKNNGKSYVGVTSNPSKRYYAHKSANGSSPAFHNAINKYGFDAFEYEVVEEFDNIDDAYDSEIEYIRFFDSVSPNGYNISEGGKGGVLGNRILSEEDVDDIIDLHFNFDVSVKALAEKFECNRLTVSDAINRRGLKVRRGLPISIVWK